MQSHLTRKRLIHVIVLVMYLPSLAGAVEEVAISCTVRFAQMIVVSGYTEDEGDLFTAHDTFDLDLINNSHNGCAETTRW